MMVMRVESTAYYVVVRRVASSWGLGMYNGCSLVKRRIKDANSAEELVREIVEALENEGWVCGLEWGTYVCRRTVARLLGYSIDCVLVVESYPVYLDPPDLC